MKVEIVTTKLEGKTFYEIAVGGELTGRGTFNKTNKDALQRAEQRTADREATKRLNKGLKAFRRAERRNKRRNQQQFA